jgi:hypothetical protein
LPNILSELLPAKVSHHFTICHAIVHVLTLI